MRGGDRVQFSARRVTNAEDMTTQHMLWANGTRTDVTVDGELVRITDISHRLAGGQTETVRTMAEVLDLADEHDELNRILRAAAKRAYENERKNVTKDHGQRPQSEAQAQAELHGRQTDYGTKHEGYHVGDTSGRRAGAGDAGQGSNRSQSDE